MKMRVRTAWMCLLLVATSPITTSGQTNSTDSLAIFRQTFVPIAASGQTNSTNSTRATVPDFSGLWSHPFLPGFEPPASGPGPVTNLMRGRDGRENFNELVGNYKNPILKPEAARIVKQHGDLSLAGKGYETPSNQCWPDGVPYVFWNLLLEFLPGPDHITLIYRLGQQVRVVRMNQPHPAHVTPSWYGDSVGHYEGDTLVIDTVGIKTDRPYAMVDWYGTPFSERLHVVERYRLVDYAQAADAIARNDHENTRSGLGSAFDPKYRGKVLQLQFTVEDAGVFTTPWTATITYRPSIDPWPEYICAESPHWFTMDSEAHVPTAKTLDF
jgi:hypothetical protein